MTGTNPFETSQHNALVRRFLEIRQDAISAALNAERGLEAIGYHVESAIVPKKERRQSNRRKTPANKSFSG